MTGSIDYAHIADLYDTFVKTDFDVAFFLKESQSVSGEVLELTSGTGRLSLPLIEAGVRLTCVDQSAEMLSVLRENLAARKLCAPIHQADMCHFSLGKKFDLIIIPFNAFAELTSLADQHDTLTCVRQHLSDTGRFICTLHNPSVRLKRVDGQLRLWGKFPLDNDQGVLLLLGLENLDPSGNTVSGLEFFEEYDKEGKMRAKRLLEIHFSLPEKQRFEERIAAAGFKPVALYGDYSCAPFQEDTSPAMIWVLQKTQF